MDNTVSIPSKQRMAYILSKLINNAELSIKSYWMTYSLNPKSELLDLSNLTICSYLSKTHKYFMDHLDITTRNNYNFKGHDVLYKYFLKQIKRYFRIMKNNHELGMPLHEDEIISLLKQIESRHLTELELEYEPIKPLYDAIVNKAKKLIESIQAVTPELKKITSQSEVITHAIHYQNKKAKKTMFNALCEKIKYYMDNFPYDKFPYNDYDRQESLLYIYQNLISSKQRLMEIDREDLMQEAIEELFLIINNIDKLINNIDTLISNAPNTESKINFKPNKYIENIEDIEEIASIIDNLDIQIQNASAPESRINIRDNDEGYINLQTILQKTGQLCAI